MKLKELLTRKRLLFSLVAVATIATSFILYATMHTTTPPTSSGNSIPALPTDTDGGDVLQAFGVTGSGPPSGSFTANQLVGNSQVRQGHGGAGFGAVVDESPSSTQLADYSDVDSSGVTNADQVVHRSDGKGSGTSPDDFTKILLANNDYPKHDHDFQAFESHVSVAGEPESLASDRSSADLNEPKTSEPKTSHVPEPASMLLLCTALVGVAVCARKLKKM